MNREEKAILKYQELFGNPPSSKEDDPELMRILRSFIFGEIFSTGQLDDQTRELITVTVLSVEQTLPQLKAHIDAAMHIGVTAIEVREAIYQCAPFIGFPKTLNAITAANEVFLEKGMSLPLDNQGTIEDHQRYQKGWELQKPLYGDEIKERYQDLPNNYGEALSTFLTEFCFGDFYTRKGLDIQTRELLVLCILATISATGPLYSHSLGNQKVGNDLETMYAALLHCLPYIGFPKTFAAISAIKE